MSVSLHVAPKLYQSVPQCLAPFLAKSTVVCGRCQTGCTATRMRRQRRSNHVLCRQSRDGIAEHFSLIFRGNREPYIICPDFRRERHYKAMGGVYLFVRSSICRVPRPNSRTEKPRKPNIDRNVVTREQI